MSCLSDCNRSNWSVFYTVCQSVVSNKVTYITSPPVTVRSKAWICGRLLAGIAGSNIFANMTICL